MKLFKLRYLLGTLITLALLVTVVGAVSNETISVLLNRMLTVKATPHKTGVLKKRKKSGIINP